ncbi:TolC family outer membrane protein [Rhodobacter sp. KR11]|uniref:TolC family outer membrane protein n=1 Tax=Rhodobacter sp. KR11 TaxID=2974588 RepID=UPI0022230450|nr:TolC family outer membrane protein [Rhodobacter sp. KR11]MCW1917828.1 TolC family outer membrane protein [Rhodobacter sp. KR11]
MRKLVARLMTGAALLAPMASWSETLSDALVAAYRNSNLLQQNQAVLRAADEDVATAVGTLLPVLSFQGKVGYAYNTQPGLFSSSETNSGSLTLALSQTLLDFGRGRLGIDIKNELVLATRASLVNVEQQVLLDAISAYVDMSLQTELVAAQQSNVRLITEDLKAAQDKFDVGEVTKTDVALAEAQLASARAGLAAAQGNFNAARERYNAAIGHYPAALSAVPNPKIAVRKVEEARALALSNHPVISQAEHQAKAADIGIELAKAQFRPELSGTVTITQGFDEGGFNGENLNKSVGLTLDQTIYAGGRLSSALRSAVASSQQAHAAQLQTGVQVSESVGKAWSNILVANASLSANREQIRAAQAAYDGVKQEADLGSRTTLDVLQAEQTLLSAKAAALQAQANLSISQYALLSAMGLLTAEDLQLGIPTFDPEAYYNAVKSAPSTSTRGAKLDKILATLGK